MLKNSQKKRYAAWLLCFSLILSVFSGLTVYADLDSGEVIEAIATSTPDISPSPAQTLEPTAEPDNKNIRIDELINNISEKYKSSSDAWAVFDMASGGFLSKLENSEVTIKALIDETYTSESIGQTAKDALAIKALGGDLEKLKTSDNVEFSLIEKLGSFKTENITYVTDAIFALSVYNSGSYTVSGTLSYDALLDYIFASRNSDGVWGYEWGGVSYVDYDSTAMALNALAKFYNAKSYTEAGLSEENYTKVKDLTENIVSVLSLAQSGTGTFYSSNTDAVVILGLTSIGINPQTDERFLKSENGVIDGLLSYALSDNSGFGYADGLEYNDLATEQSFRALIAYKEFLNGNEKAYNIYDSKTVDNPESTTTPSEEPTSTAAPTATKKPSGGSGSANSGGSTTSTFKVYVSVVGDTAHGNKKHSGTYPTWISSTAKTVSSGTKASDIIKTVLEDNGYTVVGIDKGYISSITSPDGVTIGEFTNGKNSGWLYKVNGKTPSVGINAYTLKSGDKVELYYSDDYTKDSTTSSGSSSSSSSSGSSNNNSNNNNTIFTDMINTESTSTPIEDNINTYDFADLDTSHWAYEYIISLMDKGILSGYDDNTCRPDSFITRAEFVTLLCRAVGDNVSEYSYNGEFLDVSSSDWYAPYIQYAKDKGYITGDENNMFMPDENITREDICVILDRVVSDDNSSSTHSFLDENDISDYAKASVNRMYNLGVISGNENNEFKPKDSATRAETAKMISKILD